MKPLELPYPILRAFKADGDFQTVKSLKLWLSDYHLEQPLMAANDNSPDAVPIEWETNVYEYQAEDLVQALHEDEQLAKDPEFEKKLPPYNADMHGEKHHRHVRRAAKTIPAVERDAEAETIRYLDAKRMRHWLGPHADVLDMAVQPYTTFTDVVQRVGTNDNAGADGQAAVRLAALLFSSRAA